MDADTHIFTTLSLPYISARSFFLGGIALAYFDYCFICRFTVELVFAGVLAGLLELLFRTQKKIPSNLLTIVSVLCLYILVKGMLVDTTSFDSRSMQPTVPAQSTVVYQKAFFRVSRGDRVIYASPLTENLTMHRIVGIPKDRIRLLKGNILVNGQAMHYAKGPTQTSYQGTFLREGREIEVLPGHYFVMGDNWAESVDSRIEGFLPQANIKGKVLLTIPSRRRLGPSID